MTFNQNVRFKAPNTSDVNNPLGLYPQFIQPQKLKGTSPPDNSIGTLGSSWTDTASGIEYIKYDDGWSPFLDIPALGPPATIPDPLVIGTVSASQLNTDLIASKAAGDIDINPTGVLKIGSNLDMQSNDILNFVAPPVSVITGNPDLTLNGTALTLDPSGFINFGSSINYQLNDAVNVDQLQGPTVTVRSDTNDLNLKSDSGNVVVDVPTGQMTLNNDINMQNNDIANCRLVSGVNATVQATTGNLSLIAAAGTIEANDTMRFNNANVVSSNTGPFTITHQATGQNISINSTGAGNVELQPGTTGNVLIYKDANMLNNNIIQVGDVTGDSVKVESLVGNIDIIAPPAGSATVSSGLTKVVSTGGSMILEAPAPFQFNDPVNSKTFVLDPLNGTILNNASLPLKLQHFTATQPIELQTAGGDILLTDGTASKTMTIKPALSQIIADSAAPFVVANFSAAQDISFSTNGGELSSNSNLDMINNEIKNVSSFNGSSGLTSAQHLSVNSSGVLAFRKQPMTVSMGFKDVGGAGVHYPDGPFNPNPADYDCHPIGPDARRLTSFNLRFMYPVAYSIGGGTSVFEIGYVATGQPCNIASFVSLFSNPVSTGANITTVNSGALDILVPANASITGRLTNTGNTPAPDNKAELRCTVQLM